MTESYGTITITDTTDIVRIENWYLASNKSSGVTISESGWTTDVTNTNAVMTANKQYLWNYEKILGTGDVVINTTDPVIIGRYGQNGGTGAAGKGISSIVEYYNTTTDANKPTSTSGFTTEVKQVDSTNKYLWNYEVINYTEGNPTTTDIRLIGVYGDPGNDAYTVILDNDSHTFSAGTSAAIATNITVKVIAYKGTTQIAATIGTISGQVTGLTTSLVSNSSVNAGFKVTVTTSLTTKSGVLTIPITVDGKSFTRKFSWSLALTGQTGTSVSSTIKYYQLATSKPSQPSNNAAIPSGWSTTQPTFDSSKLTYTLYTVIQTTYSNGNIVYSAVQVDSAFEAAKVAYQQAVTAQGIATTAQTSADGKNTIYYADGPTGPSSSTYTLKIGDTWFDTNDGNRIYCWTGSAWSAIQLGQNAIQDAAITNAKIGNLDAGSITTGDISAERMKVNSISAINSNTGTVQIAANKVAINGTAIFNNSDFQTALNNQGYQTANDVSEAISNISIGGRNLLLDTNAPSLTKIAAGYDRYWSNNATLAEDGTAEFIEISDVPLKGIKYGVRFTATTQRTSARTHELAFRANTFEANQSYTMSFYARLVSGDANDVRFNFSDRAAVGVVNDCKYTPTSEWKKYTWTFTPTVKAENKVVYMGIAYLNIGVVEMCGFKLEKGNKATDWTPAPEDVDSAIDIVQENLNASRSWYAECQTAAATAAKVATITPVTTDFALTTGTTVAVKFTYTNTVANPTLNVNGTGAIAIKRYGDTAPSTSAKTSWQANSINTLTYDGIYWRLNNWLNDDTTYNLGRNLHATAIKVLEAVPSGWLMAGTASGYKKIAAGLQFSLSYPLLYASAAYTANTTYTNTYETWNSVTYTTTAAIQSGAANKTIYLKGTVSANIFTIDSTNVFTVVEPTSDDGYFYIPLGILSNATTGNFSPSSSLYARIDGKFRQVTPTEIVVSQRIYYRSWVAGTVSKPTAWIEQTGNKYNDTVSVGNSGWSTKITPIANSTAETTTTNKKYLFLYTCEQRKRLDGTVDCTPVLLDESTTVIDGGNIITGTVTANQINVTDLFAQDITASGTITGATIQGANGAFTKGFDVDILFDFANGKAVEDLSELQEGYTYVKQYFRVSRDSVKMGTGSYYFDAENQEWVDNESDYFNRYRDPAHPGNGETLSLDAHYLDFNSNYMYFSGRSTSNTIAIIYGTLQVSDNITVDGNKITLSSDSGDISLHNSGNNAGIWDTTNGISGYWLIAHKFENDHAYIGKHLEVPNNATIKSRTMVYEAGDQVSCNGVQCAGHLTTSKTDVVFFIPLPKPTGPNLKATISGNWTIRHADGGYILNGAALTTIGTTPVVTIYDLGIYVRVPLSTASSFANNSVICASGSSSAKITFSANT